MRSVPALVLAFALSLQSGTQSSLRLSFRGPSGETIRPDRVTLLLDWWGGGEREAIPMTNGVAMLNLDRKRFGDEKTRPNEPSRILVEARGHATLLSEPFDWPQQPLPTRLAFRNRATTLNEGGISELQLTLRRPQPRVLRFVDQKGVPAAGIFVKVYMFWTRENHCGVLEGDALVSAATDAAGRLVVPDGDFDYGIALPNDVDDVVFDREPVFYEKIVKATGPETTVTVHRFSRRAVMVEVVTRDQPLAGLLVLGGARYTGCMDRGIRPLGTTDSNGLANLRAFSSDEYRNVAICRDDKELWRAPASDFDKRPARIVLDPNYTPDPTTDLCANRTDYGSLIAGWKTVSTRPAKGELQ